MFLKAGLDKSLTLIDGLRHPYQLLLPSLLLGCHKLARLEDVDGFDHEDLDKEVVAMETLHEAARMIAPVSPRVNAP